MRPHQPRRPRREPDSRLPVVTAPRGLEEVLADELVSMGIDGVQPTRGAVAFERTLEAAYRVCLWSRVGSRVLWPLTGFPCPDADALYEGVRRLDWRDHLDLRDTFAITFVGGSETIRHNVYGALVAKDAIVDGFRQATGERPNVDTKRPDLRIYVHLRNDFATVGIDLTGEALHLRGSGRLTGRAPLKETLAAGLLHMADWPRLAEEGVPLVDPFCGAGTFLTEAAGMALDQAPGLKRPQWGFEGWLGHVPTTWRRLEKEAIARGREGRERTIRVVGYDRDSFVVNGAKSNARALGLEDHVMVARQKLEDLQPKWERSSTPRGLMITNPPYGERLGDEADLVDLYSNFGDMLRWRFLGWEAWIITGSRMLGGKVGLKASQRIPVWNGGIDCRFMKFEVRTTPPIGQPRWRQESAEEE